MLGVSAFALVAVVAFGAEEIWPDSHLASTYGPNIASEALGIFVTVLVVERLLAWQKEREVNLVRAAALAVMRTPIQSVLHYVASTYVAAAPFGSPAPSSVDELVDAWVTEAPFLDARREATVNPPRNWMQWAADTANPVKDELEGVIDRYGYAIGPELIVAIEDLLRNPVFTLFRTGHNPAVHNPAVFDLRTVETNESVTPSFGAALKRLVTLYVRKGGEPVALPAGLGPSTQPDRWGRHRYHLPAS